MMYTFSAAEELLDFAVEGGTFYTDIEIKLLNGITTTLPEEVRNPNVIKAIFEAWIRDCSGVFVKSPTVETCLANTIHSVDRDAPIVSLSSEDEDFSWTLLWTPTKIRINQPSYEIFWAPTSKKLTRSDSEEEKIALEEDTIDIQNPEQTYRIDSPNTRLIMAPLGTSYTQDMKDALEEVTEGAFPLSEGPTLRLTFEMEAQKERLRRRVREARIRAKLARHRAERMAQKFEDQFGQYPEEDDEEAQTEREDSDQE